MLKDAFEPASPPRTPHGGSSLAPLRLTPREGATRADRADQQPGWGTPRAAMIKRPSVCPGAPLGPPLLSVAGCR